MSERLKPCLKCGRIPYVVPCIAADQIEDAWRQYDPNESNSIKTGYYVECLCGLRTKLHGTKEMAVADWNLHCKQNKTEDRDQTIKADAGKRQIHLVPTQIILDIAEVREYGVQKYGDSESWKEVSVQRYIDALGRHFLAMLENPLSKDDESGIEHYKHCACNLAFLCELLKVPF